MSPYYGNYFNPYQQAVPDQLQQLRQQPMNMFQNGASQDDKIYVQNELAAQAYLVAPNSFVRLWDSQANIFYEKRADASGRPYMEAYEYKKRDNLTAQAISEQRNTIDYESKIKSLEERISTLEKQRRGDDHAESINDVAAVPTV